jgi:hypothetical protein
VLPLLDADCIVEGYFSLYFGQLAYLHFQEIILKDDMVPVFIHAIIDYCE